MTFAADVREDVPEFDVPPGVGESSNGADPDAPQPRLRLSPRLTRAEMAANPIQFLCPQARFLAIGVSTLITSLGGVGKTRLLLQLFYQLSLGQPVFGCELLRPPRPMRCLYIGAEDHQPFFNNAALPLLVHDADRLPFDVILLPEIWPGFTLTASTTPVLVEFIEQYRAEHGLDVVGLDPMLSLIGMEYADMMKNPVVARSFFNDCLAPLLASQAFSLISGNHDSKTGAAVTGSADQQNAARCVLQLTTEGPNAAGQATIAAERHKDNLGFRFSKLVLERDPETLLLTWNESQSSFAYGAPPTARQFARPPADAAEVRRYLSRQAPTYYDRWRPQSRAAPSGR
ncbi:MAG: AAA family ATPase [Candidatus Binatia bacterium]